MGWSQMLRNSAINMTTWSSVTIVANAFIVMTTQKLFKNQETILTERQWIDFCSLLKYYAS